MRTPEQRMFLNVITQAIHDAAYKGDDRYYSYHRDQARAWLVSNSIDFRVIYNNYVETIIKNKNQNERIVLVVIG